MSDHILESVVVFWRDCDECVVVKVSGRSG